MSTPYELNGRVDQKRRTRDALVAAARDLIALGEAPTVEQAAEAASISRATAYRYFPNQRSLLASAHPETATSSLLPANPPEDVAQRLDLVVEAFTHLILDTEAQQRTMLRLSLEADPAERAQLPLRQGRGILWIEDALAPLRSRLSAAEVHRIALAVRSAIGIEAYVWLTDIGGVAASEAVDIMRSTARALLAAALAELPADQATSAP
ncbi:MAG: TetR/AcrR family transcriptional regulator [Microthrixaceae bacterium]